MKKILALLPLLMLLSCAGYASEYAGCKDPRYLDYVSARLSKYENNSRESYWEETKALKEKNFDSLSEHDQTLYLFSNVISSARFDTKQVAIKNINRYIRIEKEKPFWLRGGDMPHQINIARGWLALREGKEQAAIVFLMKSTKTKGSPVLGSFGPDMTLIRNLYQRGYRDEVLQYLRLSQAFWDTERANEYVEIWKKMISHNCPIQFQFYDTISIQELNLPD